MAERLFDIPETKGQFQVKGVVSGTEKDKFFVDKFTKTRKPFRSVNFGVQFDKNATMYVGFNGMAQDNVWFSKSEKDLDGKKKTTTKKIPWNDRFNFHEDGFRMIGVNVGVKKTTDESGKEVNDKKTLSQFDACKEIAENLKDDESVFVKGNIEYSTYQKKHQTRFEPAQVSLCKAVDFEDKDFKSSADFQQVIVFTGIEKSKDAEDKFVVSAKIVTYNTIEDAEFIIKDSKLANVFRKNLKPYQAIKVWGKIDVEQNTEQVVEDDTWGEKNEMTRVNAPTQRTLVITGADPKTIEKEVYTKDKIESAIAKINESKTAENDFGSDSDSSSDDWGKTNDSKSEDSDDDSAW